MKTELKDLAKQEWVVKHDNEWPGDKKFELGCLQRIADAIESIDYTLKHNKLNVITTIKKRKKINIFKKLIKAWNKRK